MLLQPQQIAAAHLRPACGKGHKASILHQGLSQAGCAGIEQLRILKCIRITRAGAMKFAQHLMQPSAKLALTQLIIQLGCLLQPQQAQRKVAIGAGAHIGIAAGREHSCGQTCSAGRGLRLRLGGIGHCLPRIIAFAHQMR